MTPSEQKAQYRQQLSRAAKELFGMMPKPTGWAFRWLFLADDGATLRWSSRRVLRHLQAFCFADRSIFGGTAGTSDSPFMLGVREGRRQTYLEIMKFLHLDESQVRQLKEQGDE
jgi:hypothetical protein